jgi:hypothetical protein
MNRRARLQRLERKARRLTPATERYDELSDESWLALFEAWGRQGYFDQEPDFATALAFYRDALLRAQAQTDPPFDPPDDYLPGKTIPPHMRLCTWRDVNRFPDVHAGWDWLAAMLRRIQEGIPPVSTAEFMELADWFSANEARFYHLSRPSDLLEVEAGRTISLTTLRYELCKGVRALGAGELAKDLRRLRMRYREDRRKGSEEDEKRETGKNR